VQRIVGRVCASAAIAIFAWYCLLLLAGYAASFGDAWLDEGRVWPYSHAHLGEEYSEGAYFPLLDPLFVFSAFARDCLAFCLGALFLTQRTTRLHWVAVYFSLSALTLYLLQFGYYIPSMLQALTIELAFMLIGVAVCTSCMAKRHA